MGPRMSTGQKAEETPLPDKRAFIPVTVQSAHDAENLYLRFEWEDTEHVPVPFVNGGKMDPENQVKLAVMLATDEVTYVGQSGCWGACHHDLRTKSVHPADPAAVGLALNVSQGVTKYIKESRTEVEEKGKARKNRRRLGQAQGSRGAGGRDGGRALQGPFPLEQAQCPHSCSKWP